MSDGAATLHRLTRHGSALDAAARGRLVKFAPLDSSNRPAPFKRYVGREPVPLTREFTVSSGRAADVLSGRPPEVVEGPWDGRRLARLLFFANGVSRVSRSDFGDATYFRTAMSAGNLHPVEIYVVCGDLDGVPAGVYHSAPLEFGLSELRRGDFRGALTESAADPRVAEAPVTLLVSGIPWRTAWKYGERGFRHLYWDAGTMLANLVAVEPSASVRLGFVDDQVGRLVGVDGVSEYPLVLVVLPGRDLGRDQHRGDWAVEAIGMLDPLDASVEAISRAPIEFPLVTAAQRDGDLADGTAVERWRAAATSLGRLAPAEVEPPASASDDPIEAVILRRGSTRLMRLGAAGREVRGDFARLGGTLLQHFVSVHGVEGVAPGAYRWSDGRLAQGREGQQRDLAAHLCFDQPLGGDSAYTVFHAADLGEVLGRLALAAFTLGYGATGLTFYDDAVAQHFGTPAACMLVTSAGVPDYRNAPGAPTELARFDRVMERLSLRLHRGEF